MVDSHERLLDMLAGWAYFASRKDETNTLEVEEIDKLYQIAGTRHAMTDRDVHQFLADKVYPLLCGVKSFCGVKS